MPLPLCVCAYILYVNVIQAILVGVSKFISLFISLLACPRTKYSGSFIRLVVLPSRCGKLLYTGKIQVQYNHLVDIAERSRSKQHVHTASLYALQC